MAQVETGSIQMTILPTSPVTIVEYAVDSNKIAALNKNIQLKTTISENIPSVLADREKTAWVLTNLISNAIRYSHENSPIFIDVRPLGNTIRFSVIDAGQGIAPEYVGKIFDRYFRIPGTRKEGTGLGLSISKEFIEAQGGTIMVQSDFGSGSEFSFCLPADI
jgi:signal transduction histidine kinase